jgi:hypothetical protein
MTIALIGLLLTVVGGVMIPDFVGIGTKWRTSAECSSGYEGNTRRFLRH